MLITQSGPMRQVFALFRGGLVCAVAVVAPVAALAEPYTLVPGDRIEITYANQGESLQTSVDIDGDIRLPDLGGLAVAGLTLDDIETRIESQSSQSGLLLDPRVSVAIVEYAPIIVAGDVANPGRFDFQPGMTIGSALALSGGSRVAGSTRLDVERARTETEGQLRSLNLDIASKAVQIARLEATLTWADTVALSPELLARIPNPNSVDLETLIGLSIEIQKNQEARNRELLYFWEEEIETIEAQLTLFNQRIQLQEEIVASTAEDLAVARDLQERGLQTAARLSSAEQRDADARNRALELETARIAATRSISDARRARANFLALRQEENLLALQQARVDIDALQVRYARTLEQLAVLTGGSAGSMMDSSALELQYSLFSPRADRADITDLSPTTRLLPGDTVFVSVQIDTSN